MVWLYSRRAKLLDCRLEEDFTRYLTRLYMLSLGVYLLSFLISFRFPSVSMALSVGLTLLYLLPPRHPQYRESVEAQSSAGASPDSQ
jgi:hypothetical protein